MDTPQENKQDFRTDLPELKVGDRVEVVTKFFSQKDKEKYRLVRFKGVIIGENNPRQISRTFAVLKESGKVAVRNVYSYHSPSIVSIKKLGEINEKVHQAKLNYLERELAAKKDNE